MSNAEDEQPPSTPGDRVSSTVTLDAAQGGDEQGVTRSLESGGGRGGLSEAKPGQHLGRYVVLEHLGAGAMGLVLAAYDPELDRRVALKVLHADRAQSGRARERLAREARACAQISHPNVVHVYEVGEVDAHLYLAMEYVEGGTLTAWLAAQHRSVEQIVSTFRMAGEGLAAAHDAGILHRDFKPDNVLVADDGRVRVADFGLAGTQPLSGESSASGDVALTRTGTILGTPAYLSPEVFARSLGDGAEARPHPSSPWTPNAPTGFDGSSHDPRSDQYSFCVALYEAVYGDLPFAAPTLTALCARVLSEAPRFPSRADVDGQLRAVLERGLSKDPEARFASMRELLDALAPVPARRRRGLALSALALLALLVVGVGGYRWVTLDPCAHAGDAMRADFSPSERDALHAHVASTGGSLGAEVAAQLLAQVDAYIDTWAQERKAVCRATHVEHAQSAAMLDLRMACFDDQRSDLKALLRQLRGATDTSGAGLAPLRLPSPHVCTHLAYANAPDALPPDRGEALATAKSALSSARAKYALGAYADAEQEASSALALAEALPSASLEVDGRLLRAMTRERLARHEEMLADVDAARILESQLGRRHVVLQLLRQQILYDLSQDKLDQARARLDELRYLAHGARSDALLMSQYEHMAGVVHAALGAYATALNHHERSLALLTDDQVALKAVEFEHLGTVAQKLGQSERAEEALVRAIRLGEQAFGPNHVVPALTRLDLGIVYKQRGEFDRAQAEYEAALAVLEKHYDGPHPDVAALYNNLGNVHLARSEYETAMARYATAVDMRVRLFGADSASLEHTYGNMGLAHLAQGRREDARSSFERSLSVMDAHFGKDYPSRYFPLMGLAELALIEGDYARMHRLTDEARRVTEAGRGPDHPFLAEPLLMNAYVGVLTGPCEMQSASAARGLELANDATEPRKRAMGYYILARCGEGDREAHRTHGLELLDGLPKRDRGNALARELRGRLQQLRLSAVSE